MGVVYAARDERLGADHRAQDACRRRRRTRPRASASGARRAPRPASTIRTSARSTRSARTPGALFIAMELLEGEALAGAARARRPERRRGDADRARHAGRAGRAARARHRPSRPQAVERVPDAARRQAARLRPGPARAGRRGRPGRRPHAHRHASWARRATWRPSRWPASRSIRAAICSRPARSCSRCSPAAPPSPAARSSRSCTRRCYEQPPALTGSPAVAAVDRVIRRALAKRPPTGRSRPTRWPTSCAPSAASRADRYAGAGPRADAARRAAVPRPASRSGDRLPRLQPARRDRDVAVRQHRSLVVRSSAVAARFATGTPGPQGARRRSRRRSRRHGHAAALRRSAARDRPARRGARRHAAHVAHRAGVARRSLPPAGRHRPPRRRGALAAAGRHAARSRPIARTMRAPTSCTCAPTSWPGPTTASSRRAISTSSASSSIRASRRRGPGSDAAIA